MTGTEAAQGHGGPHDLLRTATQKMMSRYVERDFHDGVEVVEEKLERIALRGTAQWFVPDRPDKRH